MPVSTVGQTTPPPTPPPAPKPTKPAPSPAEAKGKPALMSGNAGVKSWYDAAKIPPLEGKHLAPSWVPDSIFYQVFPERFANGDVGNDPFGTKPWGTKPANDSFMGGDLIGLREKLPYLKDLGVNALYLNPVFESPSNHKYDTQDYTKVDDNFGGDKALKDLVTDAHANGMKVMLDGVLNHTSQQHPWFTDVRAKGPKSEHWDKYDVKNHPIKYHRDEKGVLRSDDYRSWWNYATLPELEHDNPAVRGALLSDKDSVVKRWIRDYKIDGWRMDVADEVPVEFWKEARKEIKSANPDTYLVAEAWKDASEYLKGDSFDSVMNYQFFQDPAVKYFAKKEINTDEFVQRLASPYSTPAKHAMFNLLGSHDTPRFVTQAGGDWYRARPAAIFQMTYPGAPVVYYGDEVGMQGGADPDSRRTFPWDKKPTESFSQLGSLFRTLTATRSKEPVLRTGGFEVLSTHNDKKTMAYRRFLPNEARDAVVAINNDVVAHPVEVPASPFAPDGTVYRDALSGAKYAVKGGRIELPKLDGNHGAVLLRETQRAAAAKADKAGKSNKKPAVKA